MELSNKKWFLFLRNRLSIGAVALFIFAIYILLIDENSCIQQEKYDAEIERLTEQIEAQNDTADYYDELAKKLKTDEELIEKIAREQFYMSKPGEDVYVIEEKPTAN